STSAIQGAPEWTGECIWVKTRTRAIPACPARWDVLCPPFVPRWVSDSPVVEPPGQDFGQVQGSAARPLFDLGAAAVPVGQDQCLLRGPTHTWEQIAFTDRGGDFVMAFDETEVSGQSATSRAEHFPVHACPRDEVLVFVETHDGVLLAVHMSQGRWRCPRWLPVVRLGVEETGASGHRFGHLLAFPAR